MFKWDRNHPYSFFPLQPFYKYFNQTRPVQVESICMLHKAWHDCYSSFPFRWELQNCCKISVPVPKIVVIAHIEVALTQGRQPLRTKNETVGDVPVERSLQIGKLRRSKKARKRCKQWLKITEAELSPGRSYSQRMDPKKAKTLFDAVGPCVYVSRSAKHINAMKRFRYLSLADPKPLNFAAYWPGSKKKRFNGAKSTKLCLKKGLRQFRLKAMQWQFTRREWLPLFALY